MILAETSAPDTLRRDVVPLALAQTILWAVLYYSFPALLPEWERDFGWSKTEISGAFTAALIVTALLAPLAGRLIDRGAARLIHPGGALLGAAMLVALSQVTELWQFYAVWIGIGLAMSVSLYEACFAIITLTVGARARVAITTVTLFAGFAGTLAFPSAYYLSAWLGWRGAVLGFAAIAAGLVVPLMLLGLRWLERHREVAAAMPEGEDDAVGIGQSIHRLLDGCSDLFSLESLRPPRWLAAAGAKVGSGGDHILDDGRFLANLAPADPVDGMVGGDAIGPGAEQCRVVETM